VTIISFAQLHAEVAAHWAAEAERNLPVNIAIAAIDTLSSALGQMTSAERADILDLVSSEICMAGVEPIPA